MSELAVIDGGRTPTIVEALLAFHKAADKLDLAKNRSAHTSEYLDLDKAMQQIRPLLAEHGLFVRHYSGWEEGPGWHAGTVVEHVSGECRDSGRFPLAPVKPDAQGFGGALTYAKRYTALALLGLVADNDDDGAAPRTRKPRAASGKINAAQRTELQTAVRAAGITTLEASKIVKDVGGVDSSADLPAEKHAAVLKAIRAAKPE